MPRKNPEADEDLLVLVERWRVRVLALGQQGLRPVGTVIVDWDPRVATAQLLSLLAQSPHRRLFLSVDARGDTDNLVTPLFAALEEAPEVAQPVWVPSLKKVVRPSWWHTLGMPYGSHI